MKLGWAWNERQEEAEEGKEGGGGGGKQASPVDLQVMVLSMSAWPSYPDVDLRLPREVARPLEFFDTMYRAKHTGRRLTWKHGLAHCVIKARFSRGVKELLVSAFQAVVLVLFNDAEAATAGSGGGDGTRRFPDAPGGVRAMFPRRGGHARGASRPRSPIRAGPGASGWLPGHGTRADLTSRKITIDDT